VTVRDRARVEHPEWYCPDCGHLWRQHQNGTPSQALDRDAPMPCHAVVDEVFTDEATAAVPVWCGCRRLLDDEELALEVLRGQAAQGGE